MKLLKSATSYASSLDFVPYCMLASLVVLVGSLCLSLFLELLRSTSGLNLLAYGESVDPTFMLAFGAILLAPLVETWLLAGTLRIFSYFKLSMQGTSAPSAIVWGLLHGLLYPGRFIASIWAFFIFGLSYMLWRRRSFKHAFAAAAIPHAVVNGVAVLFLTVST